MGRICHSIRVVNYTKLLVDIDRWVVYHEKTPNPLANQVKDTTVMAAVMRTTPKACFSWIDSAPLHVAHLNSFRGVYGCPVYMPKMY